MDELAVIAIFRMQDQTLVIYFFKLLFGVTRNLRKQGISKVDTLI